MNPCYGCENREVGCHGKCQLYLEYKKKLEKAKQGKLGDKEFISYHRELSTKLWRAHRSKRES